MVVISVRPTQSLCGDHQQMLASWWSLDREYCSREKVIRAPKLLNSEAKGRKIFFIFGEGGPASSQAHPARQPYQGNMYGRMCQGNNLTYPQLFLFDKVA